MKERLIPTGFTIIKETAQGIVYGNRETLRAISYTGKQSKPTWFYRFLKAEDMEKRINDFFSSLEQRAAYKQERIESRKLSKAQAREQLSIGDIFYHSWGYEQTNIDYFQIIGFKGSKMLLRELAQNREYTSDMSGKTTPIKDTFLSDSKIITKDISFHPNISSYGYCGPYDGKALYFSTYA